MLRGRVRCRSASTAGGQPRGHHSGAVAAATLSAGNVLQAHIST